MTFGQRAKARRDELELTQATVATRMAQSGQAIDTATVSRWERDVTYPSGRSMARLAAALETTVEELLGDDVSADGKPTEAA